MKRAAVPLESQAKRIRIDLFSILMIFINSMPDIWINIWNFLEIKDKVRYFAVCKSWKPLLIQFTEEIIINGADAGCLSQPIFKNLKSITISEPHKHPDNQMFWRTIPEFYSKLGTFSLYHFENISNNIAKLIMKTDITTLKIKYPSDFMRNNNIIKIPVES